MPGPQSLNEIELTEEDIGNAIDDLKAISASGPDGVPASLLKICKDSITFPLMLLGNKSLETGEIPAALKFGRIIPIYKGGDKCSPANYRPVALTSHIIKIIEKVIVKRLVKYMNEANLFNPHQHGFRKNRSCLSQLLEHYQVILRGLEDGNEVSVIYLDFCKAFDKVDHKIVQLKLQGLGISGNLLMWIASFLLGRRQIVTVDGQDSTEVSVRSGVPQGSVLGPLIFLILISDIDVDLKYAKASSFADDTRIVAVENSTSQRVVQEELSHVYDWARDNKMTFNDSKFEHLHYRVQNQILNDNHYYTEVGSLIEKGAVVKDLGVIMDSEANFEAHIQTMISKARRQAGWILRTFRTRDQVSMLTLYRATVIPILEYCSQLWCPCKVGQIRDIESVQRYFTSRISGIGHLNYWERLKTLNLYSLERRRERYLVLYVYKIILGLTPNFHDERFKIKTIYSERRGLNCLLPPIKTHATNRVKSLVERSFAVRAPTIFNNLPKHLRSSNLSFESFKSCLDKILSKVEDCPSFPNLKPRAISNSLVDQLELMKRDGLFSSL